MGRFDTVISRLKVILDESKNNNTPDWIINQLEEAIKVLENYQSKDGSIIKTYCKCGSFIGFNQPKGVCSKCAEKLLKQNDQAKNT